MIVTLDDMGHPLEPGYNHWVAWNLPCVATIPESLPAGEIIEYPIHAEQGMAYGKHCYRGPYPPFNWCHEYDFTVNTLNSKLYISTLSNNKLFFM